MGEPLYGLPRLVRTADKAEVNVNVQSCVPEINVTPTPVTVTPHVTVQAATPQVTVNPHITVPPARPADVKFEPQIIVQPANPAAPQIKIEPQVNVSSPEFPIVVNVAPNKLEVLELKVEPQVHFIGYGKLRWPTDGDSVLIVKQEQDVEYLPVSVLHQKIEQQIQLKSLALQEDIAARTQQLSAEANNRLTSIREDIDRKATQRHAEADRQAVTRLTGMLKQLKAEVAKEVQTQVTVKLGETLSEITAAEVAPKRSKRSADDPSSSTIAISPQVQELVATEVTRQTQHYIAQLASLAEVQALRQEVAALRAYIEEMARQ